MCNTTIFKKNYLWPLFVTFEVTALTSLGVCWAFFMLFGFSVSYSTYLAAETNHTLQKNLEQTLIPRLLYNSFTRFFWMAYFLISLPDQILCIPITKVPVLICEAVTAQMSDTGERCPFQNFEFSEFRNILFRDFPFWQGKYLKYNNLNRTIIPILNIENKLSDHHRCIFYTRNIVER